jgi:Mrp family chromosome partitioning ATPase
MGKTLEALRKANKLRLPVDVKIIATPHCRVHLPATDSKGPEEEIPFIEVGQGGAAIEASPSVLTSRAAPSAAPAAPRAMAMEPKSKFIPLPRHAVLADALTVAFQPLPTVAAGAEPSRHGIAPEVIAFHQPDHKLSQQYRSLLRGLLGQLPLGGPQALLLAARVGGAGASTVLLNLAVIHAQQSKKCVIVVDANLRRPAIASRLGLASAPGLRDVLTGRFPLGRALQETAQTGVLALTSGQPLSPGTPWPPATALRSILQQLRKQVDLVLVDGPSWDAGPEMASLTTSCDVLYLVLRPEEVDAPATTDLLRLIPHMGGHVGGYIVARRALPSAA